MYYVTTHIDQYLEKANMQNFTANSENLVSARAKKNKKPGHSKKEMASIKGKRKADASCS